jgi:uncharacterized protein YbjT (DUF2867 family)
LTDQRHVGKTYELTGPRSITFGEAVDEIAKASDRTIAYRQILIADFKIGLAAAGLPQETIDVLDELFSQVLDGRNSHVMNGVAEVLGRPARDFGLYAGEAAAAGVWRARP